MKKLPLISAAPSSLRLQRAHRPERESPGGKGGRNCFLGSNRMECIQSGKPSGLPGGFIRSMRRRLDPARVAFVFTQAKQDEADRLELERIIP